ncbi:MAG: class I SAM-dependent methyltransferase [Thermodesulfobacteriota bacterium]
MAEGWRQRAAVFDERAAEYDQWFEESRLFAIERGALLDLTTPLMPPGLEIGVGPGRFAAALGTRFGLDPAWAPLTLARSRGILVGQGVGEHLPCRSGAFGTVHLLFTLCFVAAPAAVLAECFRVLGPGGHLVLGLVPAGSPWGKALAAKKAADHPFYRHARFYEAIEAERLLAAAGFALVERRSTLLQSPGDDLRPEPSREGALEGAGFVVLVGRKE